MHFYIKSNRTFKCRNFSFSFTFPINVFIVLLIKNILEKLVSYKLTKKLTFIQ